MGKVEEFVQQREKEKHTTTAELIETLTAELIETLRWYIKSTEELRSEWIKSQAALNEAFNQRLHEINEKMAEQAKEVTA